MNRVAITAAIAVMVASLSMSSVIQRGGWIATGAGAIIIVAIAGAVTRLPRLPAAVVATFLVLIALVPLLTRPGWADRSAALVILVITALSATGAWPLRGFAVLACYLAASLLYLNVTFAHAAAFGGVIPSDSSIQALAHLWQSAFTEFRYAPPVPDVPSVSLVTAAGIGAVAIAVDILAVRLRRPAVAGLPLLLLFSVPVASNLKVFDTPEMLIFAASLAGYLALLSADGRERLRMWGRLVTFRHVQSADETGSGPDTKELSASGRRIGLAAVCLAIVIPVILPSMRVRDVFATTADGSGSGNGHGGSGSAGVSPLLSVKNQLNEGKPQPVLSYTTTAKDPSEQYFQVYALNYNARQNQWSAPLYGDLRAPDGPNLPWQVPGVLGTTRFKTPVENVTTRITISEDNDSKPILPMPYAPDWLSVRGSGWLEIGQSLTVLNTNLNGMQGLVYTVKSEEVDPPPAEIPNLEAPSSIDNEYTAYSQPDAAQLTRIADRVTAGAKTKLAEAKKLQNWFTSGIFTYTLKPDLPQTDWLLAFLTTDRHGYCDQFAQAFAVLARLLGIPSRIAIGYTGGTQGPGNTWDVTTADAHAWPELYFTDEGWLRFEPTPSGSNGQGTAVPPTYATGPAGNSGSVSLTPPSALGGPTPIGPGSKKHDAAGRNTALGPTGGDNAPNRRSSDAGLAIAIPAVLFLLIAWPALTRLLTRRRRWLSASGDAAAAHAAWRELTDDLADYGFSCQPGETPRAVARRVTKQAGLDAMASQAVSKIAAAEERALYARLPDPGAGLKAAVVTVRRAVAASVSPRQRLRARLFPASTVLAARHLMQRASEMLGWLDSSWPTIRRQLRRALRAG
jgi:transglutaminase-like putative cysteine protease